MRHEQETETSFNQLKQLKEITQAIQEVQKGRLKTSENAHESEPTQEISSKPKNNAQTKKGRLNPTKKAFSERQNTAFRDHSQASAKKSLEAQQSDKQTNNANAFKSDEAKERGQQ
ncbi:hypothetical protein ACQJ8Z_01885 [Helicobacter pylori]